MPEFCSCGVQLPPDAVFCHKCGKPQRELGVLDPEPEPVVAPVAQAAAIPPARQAAPVSFRNPTALRIALLTGVGAMLFYFLPVVNLVAAGFFAALFYRRKTHDLMDVGAGLQIGWITGVVAFAVQGTFFVAVGISGRLTASLLEQGKSYSMNNDPNFQQMAQFLGSPAGIMVGLVAGFVFITCLTMAGGALGAKLVGRK